MELLEEKRRKKEQEAAEKEARKRERERKKVERVELQEKKKKERLERQKQRKEAALKKKEAAAAKKRAAAARKTRSSARGQKVTSMLATPTDSPTESNSAVVSTSPGPSFSQCPAAHAPNPPEPLSSHSQTSHTGDLAEEECECAFCYRYYQEDGSEWVQCGCGRWVHEQCIEDVVLDSSGKEKFCPFCLNL